MDKEKRSIFETSHPHLEREIGKNLIKHLKGRIRGKSDEEILRLLTLEADVYDPFSAAFALLYLVKDVRMLVVGNAVLQLGFSYMDSCSNFSAEQAEKKLRKEYPRIRFCRKEHLVEFVRSRQHQDRVRIILPAKKNSRRKALVCESRSSEIIECTEVSRVSVLFIAKEWQLK